MLHFAFISRAALRRRDPRQEATVKRKIRLNRETLRALAGTGEAELRQAQGGLFSGTCPVVSICIACSVNITCHTCTICLA
jgi:hypothetical protein